jgi:hypothetical protein
MAGGGNRSRQRKRVKISVEPETVFKTDSEEDVLDEEETGRNPRRVRRPARYSVDDLVSELSDEKSEESLDYDIPIAEDDDMPIPEVGIELLPSTCIKLDSDKLVLEKIKRNERMKVYLKVTY